jgi:radical SAM superfamily enzyme YgiQ (UPF0313 family)
MKVLFAYLNVKPHGEHYYYAGLGYIIALLREHGHDVALLPVSSSIEEAEFVECLNRTRPDLVGLSTITLQWKYAQTLARWTKQRFDIPVICGGTHPTTAPEEVIADPNVDIVCVGEGEYPMLDLVTTIEAGEDYTNIPNLWVKKPAGDIVRNEPRELIQDLDALPFPDLASFDYDRLLDLYDHTICFPTGRGCLYSCTFCLNTYLRSLFKGHGPFLRRHSPMYVMREIEHIAISYPMKRIFFEDEDFIADSRWLQEFCDLYRERFQIPFGIMTNVRKVDSTILAMLSNAGCRWIIYAVETGNEHLRRKLLRKPFTNQQIIDSFQLTKEFGILPYAFVMVGIPHETPDMLVQTRDLIERIAPGHIFVSVYFPIPSTPLGELAREEGLITDRKIETITLGKSVLDLPLLSADELETACRDLLNLNLHLTTRNCNVGYASLAELVNDDRGAYEGVNLLLEYWKLWIDYLPTLIVSDTRALRFDIKLKHDTVFRFNCGYYSHDDTINRGTVVAQYVKIGHRGNGDKEVFRRECDVGTSLSRKVVSASQSIDLSEFGDDEVTLVLGVEKAGSADDGVVAFWSNPCLAVR